MIKYLPKKISILFFLLAFLYGVTPITTEENLKKFFALTYDQNNDQKVT